MASRVAEVIYRLKDLFSGPAKKVEDSYDKIKRSSRDAANTIERDNKKIGGSFTALAGSLKRVVGPLAAFAGAVKTFRATGRLADDLDRLGKTAAKLDIDPQELAGLEFAADRSGVAVQKVEAALFTLQKRAGEAELGIGAAKVAFEDLGIEAAEFNKLKTDEQVRLLADSFAALESEERRAALASALFSKGNADLLKLLNQGGDEVDRLVREFGEYRQVTEESTQAAAEFNDAWTNFTARLSGFRDKVLTPLIVGFNRLTDVFANTSDEVKPLSERLADAREELERLEESSSRSNATSNALRQQRELVEELTEALEEQTEAQEAARVESQKREAALAAAKRAEEDYQRQVDSLTTSFKSQADARKAALDQETAELRKARADQQSIEEEFKQLREDVTKGEDEDISGLDVQTKALEARRKLAEGDADAAIKAAREGADLLRDLKAEGDEAGFVLGFLADQLGNIAKEAAAQQTEAEVIDVAKAAESFNEITAKLNLLQSDAAKAGTAIGQAVVNSIQLELDAAKFNLPGFAGSDLSNLSAFNDQSEKRSAR